MVKESGYGISTESEVDLAIIVFCHIFNLGFWSLRLGVVNQEWNMSVTSVATLKLGSDYGTKFKTVGVTNDLNQENLLIYGKYCQL